ncbi:hypothetical protein [Streptomyces yangpuensis]|uniref:hypothetical protein n=1 Tax=Streptomyces yangpuensis TaxID=1648182 RepID=UPI0035DD984D
MPSPTGNRSLTVLKWTLRAAVVLAVAAAIAAPLAVPAPEATPAPAAAVATPATPAAAEPAGRRAVTGC